MRRIEYRVLYAEGQEEYIRVNARDINSGFRKAVALALRGLPGAARAKGWEMSRVEFWQVLS